MPRTAVQRAERELATLHAHGARSRAIYRSQRRRDRRRAAEVTYARLAMLSHVRRWVTPLLLVVGESLRLELKGRVITSRLVKMMPAGSPVTFEDRWVCDGDEPTGAALIRRLAGHAVGTEAST